MIQLRPYQQQAVDVGVQFLHSNEQTGGLLVLPTGCLAKGTPILMADGTHKPVEKILSGDVVLSYDSYSGINIPNEVSEVIRTSLNPKPMLELTYENETITTTYDHPFYDGERFYPLYQLIWGEMEASQRVQLELLCKQYGQALDHTMERGLFSCCNETCSRCERLLKNNDGRKDNKNSQTNRGELVRESTKSSRNKSYQRNTGRQQGREFGVVYSKIQCLDWKKNRSNKNTNSSKKFQVGSEKQEFYSRVLFKKNSKYSKVGKRESLQLTAKKISSSNETHASQDSYCSIVVKEAEPYYSICMRQAPHTYRIGKKGGFITHNSGKSLVIASIAKQLEGNTVVLQPSKEILEQNYQKMLDFGITDIGIYSASMGQRTINKITLATIGTINKQKHLLNDVQHLIIDESHACNARGGMYEEFIRFFNGKVLGLTATPYRMHAYADMKTAEQCVVAKFLTRTRPRLFSKILHITQVPELYQQGFLCPIEYEYNRAYQYKDIKLNSTGMDFDEKALQEYNKKMRIIELVRDKILTNELNHILVFTASVKEANELSVELTLAGVKSAIVSALTPKKEREQILRDFRNGNIKVVTNVGTLTTGFDFPALDGIIMARPTQSVALYYQMSGRGIRNHPGKEKVKIIDICGNVPRFGKIETFTITNENDKHRLKSDAGVLTGYNFVSHKDLEATDYKGLVESSYGSTGVMTFGKHKGKHITKLPNDYLEWARTTFTYGKYKKLFDEEYRRRHPIKVDVDNEGIIPNQDWNAWKMPKQLSTEES